MDASAQVGPGEQAAQAAPPRPAAQAVGTLALPVVVDGVQRGYANATVTLEDVLALSVDELAATLAPLMNAESLSALRSTGAGMTPADRFRALGLGVVFDPASISLQIDIPVGLRGEQIFTSAEAPQSGLEQVSPSRFAVGLTGALVASSSLDGDGEADSRLLLSGFTNLGGALGVNILFGGDLGLGGRSGFERDRIIAFRDMPDRALRFSAGDLAPTQARMAGAVDVLGLSIERNYQALQPLRNVRSTGRRSLVLERRSTVEIYVNGALVQSFVAQPGPVDIRNIPLAQLSNDVSIVVEDDLGRREAETFSAGGDLSLLSAGMDEFNLSFGVLRDDAGGRLSYSSEPVASLFYSRGLRDDLTVAGHALLTAPLQSVGGSAALVAADGVVFVESAVSHADDAGSGVALAIAYRGDPFGQAERDGLLNVRLEHRTRGFRDGAGWGVGPGLKSDVAADYRLRLSDRTAASVGVSYSSDHSGREGRTAFAGVTRSWGAVTTSATIRYAAQTDRRDEVGGLLTLSLPVGARGSGYAAWDTASRTTRAEYRRRRDLDYPAVDMAVRALQRDNETELGGRLGYETARFDAAFDVSGLYGEASDRSTGTVRLQSGLAYVDGRLGFGRDPGRGFLLVDRHASLARSPVEVRSGAGGRLLGRADGLGPAVIPVAAPYRRQEVHFNVLEAPPGYDVGPGGYTLLPGAASGLVIQVGDDAYRMVLAHLVSAQGEPVALATGQIRNLATGDSQPFFTNAQGRVVFNRLRPGQYRVLMDDDDTTYVIEVSDDAQAYTELGHLQPKVTP